MSQQKLAEIRNRLDMSDPKDIAAWDELMNIQATPRAELIKDFVDEIKSDLSKLEEQIEFYERLRLKNINNKVLRKQASDILVALRKEAHGLRETTRDKAYQRVDS